jgi:hypothetical protein
MAQIRGMKAKEIDRMELKKHLNQDDKSAKNPKGGFRQKLIDKEDKTEFYGSYYNY